MTPVTRAALFEGVAHPLTVTNVEIEEPGPGDVLVRMSAIGICGSDLHVTRGEWSRPTPMILGHEGAGVVEEVGAEVHHIKAGDRVVLSWAPSCGSCSACERGRPATCSELRDAIAGGTLIDGTTRISRGGAPVYRMTAVGALAERVLMPGNAVIPIPDAVPATDAALVGCAATTGVGAVENAAKVTPRSRALVIGAGGVGQFIVQALRIVGAGEIVAVDPNERRRAMAMRVGATGVIDPADVPAGGLPGGFDYCFEAVGSPEAFELAVAGARTGGTAVMVGMTPAKTELRVDPADLTVREKVLTGSLYGSGDPRLIVGRIFRYLEDGLLDLQASVGSVYPLAKVNDAITAADRGTQAGRIIVTPEDPGLPF